MTYALRSTSHKMTLRVGELVGRSLEAGDAVLLRGELGAGKTCLTQGILMGLDCSDIVRSPTFVLVTEYESEPPLYHVDLYRTASTLEVENLQLDEYLYGDGICVIEWAEKGGKLFPEESLNITMSSISEETRLLEFDLPSHLIDGLSGNLEKEFELTV